MKKLSASMPALTQLLTPTTSTVSSSAPVDAGDRTESGIHLVLGHSERGQSIEPNGHRYQQRFWNDELDGGLVSALADDKRGRCCVRNR